MQAYREPLSRLFRAAAAFRRNLRAMNISPREEAKFLDDIEKGTFYAAIPIIIFIVWLMS